MATIIIGSVLMIVVGGIVSAALRSGDHIIVTICMLVVVMVAILFGCCFPVHRTVDMRMEVSARKWEVSPFPVKNGANYVLTEQSSPLWLAVQGYDEYGTPKLIQFRSYGLCFVGTDSIGVDDVLFRRLMPNFAAKAFAFATWERNVVIMNEERLRSGEANLITLEAKVFYIGEDGSIPPEMVNLLGVSSLEEILALPEKEDPPYSERS